MQPEVTLRDTFAAAALTGILASDGAGTGMLRKCQWSYRIADAMLRERATTIHDAAPAARAHTDVGRDRTDKPAPRPDAGTGDTHARFCSAVMHFISEATSSFATEHPNSRRIMADACAECWDAFDRIAYPTTTHSAPACDGADVLSTPDSGGRINRAAQGGQPPARSGESERRDVPQPENGRAAGGPAHQTQEPLAWAVLLSDGQTYSRCDYRWEADALAAALPANEGVTATVAPLYHSPTPTLTDEEREAVVRAWHGLLKLVALDKQLADVHLADARTINALLERTRNG